MKTPKVLAVSTLACLLAAFSAPALAQEEQQYLPDVENLTGNAVSAGAELAWDAVAGADMYTVYYGISSVQDDGGMYDSSVIVENATTYTISDLVPGTTYYFAVAAEDSTGQYLGSYSYSNEVTVVPLEAQASGDGMNPAAPEGDGVDVNTGDEGVSVDTNDGVVLDVTGDGIDTTTNDEDGTQVTVNDGDITIGDNDVMVTEDDLSLQPVNLGLDNPDCTGAGCNESQALPQSGPGLAVLLGASGLGALLFRRKRK